MNKELRIYVKQVKDKPLSLQLLRAAVAILLFISILTAGSSMFRLEYHVLWPVCVGSILIFAMTLFWDSLFVICGVTLAVGGFFFIGFALRSRFVVNGLFVVLNQCIRAVGTQTPHIYRTFTVNVSAENALLFATFFMVLLAAMLAALCALTVNLRSRCILLVLLAVFVLLSLKLQIAPGKAAVVLLVFGFLMAFAATGTSAQTLRANCNMLAFMIPLTLIVSVCAFVLAPAQGVRPMFSGLLEKLRYEDNPVDNYPRGQLSQLKKQEQKDGTALKVTMETPYATYLRGFVGSYFDNENWQPADQTVTFDNSGTFYWMHSNGMYAWNQLARLYELQGVQEGLQSVQVENVHADSRYLYLPYETASLTAPALSTLRMNCDETAVSQKWRGTRSYSFQTYQPVWQDTVALGTGLFNAQEAQSAAASRYLEMESRYNTFVYAEYTKLTDEQRSVFKRLQTIAVNSDAAHISYEAANEYVKTFLNETLTYDEEASYAAKDDDFLRSLLMEEKKGNDVHYATVAALYYRYLGIPARYVEGYVVTADDAEAMEAGKPYVLTGKNAHAWTEIYMDTIGWVPVKVTP